LSADEGRTSPPVAKPRTNKALDNEKKESPKTKNGKMTVQSKPTGKPVSKNGVICRVQLLDGKDVELEVDVSSTEITCRFE